MATEQPAVTGSGSGRKARLFSWLLALLVPAFAVWTALASPIEEHTFDAASFHIYRGVVFSAARAEGILYPYWVTPINNGLGGPLFSFYSPGVYFLMDALHSAGLSHPLAWRVLVALALMAASIGTFGLGLWLFRRADVSLIGAAAFTYAPFLLRDLFERGSPQGIALALSPWVVWTLCLLAEKPSGLRLAFAAAAWAAVILIHNLTGLALLPVIGLFMGILAIKHSRRIVLMGSLALVVALLLSAVHILPFLVDRDNVQLDKGANEKYTQLTPEALSLTSLFALPAMLDTGLDNNTTGTSIGLLHNLMVLAGMGAVPVLWRKKRLADSVLLAGLILLWGIAVALRTSLSAPLWEAYPALDALQLRWRFLGITGLAAAIAAGYLVDLFPRRLDALRGASVVLLTAALIGLQLPMLYPQLLYRYAHFSPSPSLAEIDAFTRQVHAPGLTLTAFNELLPRWRSIGFTEEERQQVAASPLANLPEGARIISQERRTGHFTVHLETPSAFQAALHSLYFPGWQGAIDGASQPLSPMDGTGYVLIDVPAGEHTLSLDYGGTTAQHIGGWVTVGAVGVLLLMAVLWRPVPASKESYQPVYFSPRWWVIPCLAGIVLIRGLWVDPYTSLLRWTSTCDAIHDAQTQVDVAFGEQVRLCGYKVEQTMLHPGGTLRAWLYWQADRPAEAVAYSYVHILGTTFNPATNNPIWGQQDKQIPAQHPLTEWTSGKLYRDEYEFTIAADTPPGEYQLEIGWYLPDGRRLAPEIGEGETQVSLSAYESVIIATIIVW